MPARGIDTPDALLPGEPHAGERLPGLRGRARGVADAGAACSRKAEAGWRCTPTPPRAAQPQDGARVPRLVGRPLPGLGRPASAGSPTTTSTRRGTGRRRRHDPRPRDAPRPGEHHRRSRRARPRPSPAGEGRQRPVRPRLLASASSATSASRPAATDAQNTSPSRSRAAASTPASRPNTTCRCPSSACVYCGNCIGVCPTGALMREPSTSCAKPGTWDESRQTNTDTICPVLRRRLHALAARSGQPDRQGDLAARS